MALGTIAPFLLGGASALAGGSGKSEAARQQRIAGQLTAALGGDVTAARQLLNCTGRYPGRGCATQTGKDAASSAVQRLAGERADVLREAERLGPLSDSEAATAPPTFLESLQREGRELLQDVRAAAGDRVQRVLTGAGAAAGNAIDPSRERISIPTDTTTLVVLAAALVLGLVLVLRR